MYGFGPTSGSPDDQKAATMDQSAPIPHLGGPLCPAQSSHARGSLLPLIFSTLRPPAHLQACVYGFGPSSASPSDPKIAKIHDRWRWEDGRGRVVHLIAGEWGCARAGFGYERTFLVLACTRCESTDDNRSISKRQCVWAAGHPSDVNGARRRLQDSQRRRRSQKRKRVPREEACRLCPPGSARRRAPA